MTNVYKAFQEQNNSTKLGRFCEAQWICIESKQDRLMISSWLSRHELGGNTKLAQIYWGIRKKAGFVLIQKIHGEKYLGLRPKKINSELVNFYMCSTYEILS